MEIAAFGQEAVLEAFMCLVEVVQAVLVQWDLWALLDQVDLANSEIKNLWKDFVNHGNTHSSNRRRSH